MFFEEPKVEYVELDMQSNIATTSGQKCSVGETGSGTMCHNGLEECESEAARNPCTGGNS